MTTPAKRVKLTALDLEVLKGARDRRLKRSVSIVDLYDSYLGSRKVNRQVDKLTGGVEPLLALGEQAGPYEPWLLTAAGRQVLDAYKDES